MWLGGQGRHASNIFRVQESFGPSIVFRTVKWTFRILTRVQPSVWQSLEILPVGSEVIYTIQEIFYLRTSFGVHGDAISNGSIYHKVLLQEQ